jgi:hypothetical protein
MTTAARRSLNPNVYEYRNGPLSATVAISPTQWWIVLFERGWPVVDATGAAVWGARQWFGLMLLCSLARDWCAHGVGFRDARSAVFGVPSSGMANVTWREGFTYQRRAAERAAVERTQ